MLKYVLQEAQLLQRNRATLILFWLEDLRTERPWTVLQY